jgi:hypothetical protein
MSDDDTVWPDDLEMGDVVTFNGDKYEVTGTGPAEATIEPINRDRGQAEVFRWAFTGDVGIELEMDYTQDEFGEMVSKDDE